MTVDFTEFYNASFMKISRVFSELILEKLRVILYIYIIVKIIWNFKLLLVNSKYNIILHFFLYKFRI